MTSLALRHRAKTLGRKAGAASSRGRAVRSANAGQVTPAGSDSRAASEYEVQLAGVGEDLRALKAMQSVEAKIELKAHLLPKYDAWVEGVLQAANDAESAGKLIGQDLVLVESMIWAIDAGDTERALPRIRTAIRHGMELPQRFDRTIGCMIAEEFAESALKTMGTDHAHIPDPKPLLEIAELTGDHDMPDQARAKLHKAIGMAIGRAADATDWSNAEGPAGGKPAAIEACLAQLRRALALDEKSGVKKMIEQRERELKKLAEAQD